MESEFNNELNEIVKEPAYQLILFGIIMLMVMAVCWVIEKILLWK